MPRKKATWKTQRRDPLGRFVDYAKGGEAAGFIGEWVQCPESSNVVRFCYAMAKLIIDYANGSEYGYLVPPYYYNEMKIATSKGKFVWNRLRKANKPYRIMRAPFMKPIGEVRRDVPYRAEPKRERRKLGEVTIKPHAYKEKTKWKGGETW